MRIRLHNPLGIYEIGKRQKQEDAIYPQLEQLSASRTMVRLLVRLWLVPWENGLMSISPPASNSLARR